MSLEKKSKEENSEERGKRETVNSTSTSTISVTMSSPISYESLMAGFMALEGKEQHKFYFAIGKHLLGKPARKSTAKKEPTGGAAGGAASAEPKERKVNWWTEATKRAMPLLKPILEEINAGLVRDGFKKFRISCVTQFLGGLKETGELGAEVFPADNVLEKRFKSFLVEYGKSHAEAAAPAPAESEGESAASGGSKSSKKSKFSDLSPEEQTARRKEAAKKAAAKRKANKAAAGGADDE